MKKLIFTFFEVPRVAKRIITLAIDACFVAIAVYLAFYLRVEHMHYWYASELYLSVAITAFVSTLIWMQMGLYRSVIRFMTNKAFYAIVLGCILSAVAFVLISFVLEARMPRSVPFIYFTILLLFVGGSRLLVRSLINSQHNLGKEPVVIYGAGSSGRQLCYSLQHGAEYNPVAFVDDNRDLQNTIISGIKVHQPASLSDIIRSDDVKKVLLAIPSCSGKVKAKIIEHIESCNVDVLTIPGSADLVSGKYRISELRQVAIEDLLGRDSVEPNQLLMARNISGKNILVTGAGGSIGSELCRQVASQKPAVLVLYEMSEFSLYSIEKELRENIDAFGSGITIVPILGSVLNKKLLSEVVATFDVHTVFHAAAYKHVPMVEFNVAAGLNNNVWGTLNVAQVSVEQKVETMILISTDKAVRPTNVMGASKRLSELVLQAYSKEQTQTCFSMVRFGNVLGSSGSVVPLFKKQIAAGGPVTVTHPEITRFFMTIPEAAQLVIQAGGLAQGGEVFVLDMGESVKIDDLARNLIHLSGLSVRDETTPDGDISIEYSGLRPGEKLYEELLIGGDIEGTSHNRIMKATEVSMTLAELLMLLDALQAAMQCNNVEVIRKLLQEAPLGYKPSSNNADLCSLKVQQNARVELARESVVH